MLEPPPAADRRSRAVQTAPEALVHEGRTCETCGARLRGRQTIACSERCRAIRWRLRQAKAQRDREQEVRASLLAARTAIEAALNELQGERHE
jgi:hypothetical protein